MPKRDKTQDVAQQIVKQSKNRVTSQESYIDERPQPLFARDLLCYWETEHLNVRQRELAGLLNITQSAVSMAAGHGRIQKEELKLSFEI